MSSIAEVNNRFHTIRGSQIKALVELAGCRGSIFRAHLSKITTSMNSDIYAHELAGYPDRELVDTIVQGITAGFKVGYDQSKHHKSPEQKHAVSYKS